MNVAAASTVMNRLGLRLRASRDMAAATGAILIPTLASAHFLLLLALSALVVGTIFGLDLAYQYGRLEGIKLPALFSLEEEFALGEMWEYLLCTAAGLTLLGLSRRVNEPVLTVLGLLFLWLTLDNLLALHERAGAFLGPLFSFMPPSRLQLADYGELACFAVIGTVALASLFKGLRGSSGWAKAHAYAIMGCFAVAAGCGVAIDFIHSALHDGSPLLAQVLLFVEDGGELAMITVSALLAIAMRPLLVSQDGQAVP